MTPRLDPARWQAVSALLDTAFDLGADERAAWLAALDASEPELAPWVRQLLAAHASAQTAGRLERGPRVSLPAVAAGAAQGAAGLGPGSQVGPWRLTALLGRGGMATVWLAQRADGSLSRPVALKLPSRLALVAGLAERFARERDILARLEHPHIARLYDAGVDADGTPWMAMEWVADGRPMDQWCDSQGLGVEGRLALFDQVLDAVQYAHARLVIHRDLKPGNILVTPDGQVRLLDFGIARLLAAPDDAHGGAPLTQDAGARLLTPAYAAPEQLQGQLLTTATDVYSLGVVLYELLAGVRPPPAAGAEPTGEAGHAARQPVRASRAAADAAAAGAAVAGARSTTVAKLCAALAGDLDTVLAKALHPDPACRYAGAAALADDLRRHRQGLPLVARPEGPWARARRLLRRHRLAATAAVSVLLALSLGLAAALWQADRAEAQRLRAEAARQRSDNVRFFLGDLLGEAARAGPSQDPLALLARAERLARAEFADRPQSLADVLLVIAQHRGDLENSAAAITLLDEAIALLPDSDQRRDAECSRALHLGRSGRTDEAIVRLQGLAVDPATPPLVQANCGAYLSDLLRQRQRLDEALAAVERAYEAWRRVPQASPQYELGLLTRKAGILMNLPRLPEAEALYARAHALSRALGRGHGDGSVLDNNWALARFMAGDLQGARERWDANLERLRSSTGERGPPPVNLLNPATARLELGQHAQALALYDEVLVAAGRYQDPSFAASALCLGALALAGDGDLAAARARLARGRALPLADSPNGRIAATNCQGAAARLDLAGGRPQAAREAFTTLLAAPGLRPHLRSHLLQLRAQAARAAGDARAALQDARASLAAARTLQDDSLPSLRRALALLAQAEAESSLGQLQAAGLAQARSELQAAAGSDHPAWARIGRLQADMPASGAAAPLR